MCIRDRCLAGYAVKVAGYALSTMLAHVSAYTILEGLRLRAADRLMGAPLGEVESRPIGAMKSTIVDRIEDIEPPLAHMIPELSSNILLPDVYKRQGGVGAGVPCGSWATPGEILLRTPSQGDP